MMNAFLQFQDQLEEQFLNTIPSSHFADIFQANVDFFQEYLQSSFSYRNFTARTARAKNPLHQFDDLVTYMALYGYAHYQRMQTVIYETQLLSSALDLKHLQNACVIDYGCGQGIATLAFIDYMIESNATSLPLKVILIEPSAYALKRAIHWIQQKAKSANIQLDLVTYCCTFDELDTAVLAANVANSSCCFHLFSNVLDMYSTGSFSLSKLVHNMKIATSESIIMAVSPDFPTGNQGFDELHHLLKPHQVFFNTTGTTEVEEYRYTTLVKSKRYAPVRVYAAKI